MSLLLRTLRCKTPRGLPRLPGRSLSTKAKESGRRFNIVITFDAFGTLIRPRPSVAEQYLDAAKNSGLVVNHIDPSSLFASFKKSFEQLDALYPNFGSYADRRIPCKEWWDRVVWTTFAPYITLPKRVIDTPEMLFPVPPLQLPEGGDEALYSNACKMEKVCKDLWWRFMGPAYEPFLDVWPLLYHLQSLKARQADLRIILGVISNSDWRMTKVLPHLLLFSPPRKRESPFASSLAGLPHISSPLDFICISHYNGYLKPDKIIFRSALKRAGDVDGEGLARPYTSTIHIGDDAATDVRGALDAGWDRAVLLRRSDTTVSSHHVQRMKDNEGENGGKVADGDREEPSRERRDKARTVTVESLMEVSSIVEEELTRLRAANRRKDRENRGD